MTAFSNKALGREDVIRLLGEDWTRLQACIGNALHSDIRMLDELNHMILRHEGKMVRPSVTILTARACSGGRSTESTIKYAAAVELLHNATLLHDDVADESDTRRGLPTLRALLGPGPAVLVGDFWLSKAVDQILAPGRNDRVITLFSKTLSDLAEGEMLQLEKAKDLSTELPDYYRIIHCKTGSLFTSAAECGALSVDAEANYVEAARSYGKALGTAFQIKDDILDYVGDGSLGKPVGIDLKEKKITLPLFLAMQGTPYEAPIRKKLQDASNVEEISKEIRKFVLTHEGVEKAEKILEEYVGKALAALVPLPECEEKEKLQEIAKYNLARRK